MTTATQEALTPQDVLDEVQATREDLEAENEALRRRVRRIESALGGISGPLAQFLDDPA